MSFVWGLGVLGYAKQGRKIAVSPIAALPVKTRFHEVGHVMLGPVDEGDIAGINVMAQRQAGFPVDHIAQTHMAKMVPVLVVMAALRRGIASIGAGNEGVKVGGVISQQAAAEKLLPFHRPSLARFRHE